MSLEEKNEDASERRLKRERAARQRAEQLLEDKSRELYNSNQTLQSSLNALQDVMHTAPSVILTVDQSGSILSANNKVEKLLNISPENIKDKDIKLFIPNLKLNNITEEMVTRIETKVIGTDNIEHPIELSASIGNIGTSAYYTLMMHDISARKAQEKEVKILNQRLVDVSRQTGISEIAASILHNIGNVLNSVNTSVSLLNGRIRKSRVTGIDKVAGLLNKNSENLSTFFASDKGSQVCDYISVLAQELRQENSENLSEIDELERNIKHIEMIISAQQKNAHHTGIIQEVSIGDLISDCVDMNLSSIENYNIDIQHSYKNIPTITLDRHKLMQILVNLIRNAKDSLVESKVEKPTILITVQKESDFILIQVDDNGLGMDEEVLAKLFSFGFTTKKDGHGFGLHSCSIEAKNLGGSLTATSKGKGQGACFSLKLPLNSN